MKQKYVTRAKFVDFQKTARSMNQRIILKQVNQKMCGNCAEHRAIVWVLGAKFEYKPPFFAADGYEPEIKIV